MQMTKKELTYFGCISIVTFAKTFSILDVFMTAGFFLYAVMYSYQFEMITVPIKVIMLLSLCYYWCLSVFQCMAIHGIYNKYFGIIIFNCIFKLVFLSLIFGLIILTYYYFGSIVSYSLSHW